MVLVVVVPIDDVLRSCLEDTCPLNVSGSRVFHCLVSQESFHNCVYWQYHRIQILRAVRCVVCVQSERRLPVSVHTRLYYSVSEMLVGAMNMMDSSIHPESHTRYQPAHHHSHLRQQPRHVVIVFVESES
jgi:hypothetical protein